MRFTAITVLGLLAACHSATTSPLATDAAIIVHGSPVTLSMRASTATLRPGAVDTLRVTLSNQSRTPVVLHFSTGCQILIYIRDAGGSVVLPGGGGWLCTEILTQLTVPAEGSVVREFLWSGSTAFFAGMPLRPLPAGTYYVTAEVSASEGMLRTSPIAIVLQDAAP